MGSLSPDHQELARDFLRLTPADLQAKYPEDQEVQGALAQITTARRMYKSQNGASINTEDIDAHIMRRIALNLAQGLPVLLPNLDSICRDSSLHK